MAAAAHLMARLTHQRPCSPHRNGMALWLVALVVVAAALLKPAACAVIDPIPINLCAALGNANWMDRLTVLGDSNSDAGNASWAPFSFYKQIGRPDPTYHPGGRFSGGPVWTDYVNTCLDGTLRSYAVGYGTMCKANGFRSLDPTFPAVPVISVEDQAFAYLTSSEPKPRNRVTLLWAGPNDMAVAFFNDADGPAGPIPSYLDSHRDEVINGIINCTVNNIYAMIAKGEQRFIVMNMQPLDLAWLIQTLDKTTAPGVATKLGNYVAVYNKRLLARINTLVLPAGVYVHLLDIYKPITAALTGVVPVPGVTDLVNRCLPVHDAFSLLQAPPPLDGPVCSDRTKLANWDSSHLNSMVHKYVIAKTVVAFLKSKGYICACQPLRG